MRLETLVPAKTKHEPGLQRWTSGSQSRILRHASPFVLCLRLQSRQANRALIVVMHMSAARVYKFPSDPRVRCRTPSLDDRAAPARSSATERSMQAPGKDITWRNQGLERPIPSNRHRTHSPSQPVISTGTLASLTTSGNIATLTWSNHRLRSHTL